MQTNLEDISSVKKKIVVVIEADSVDKKLDEAYRDIQKKARIPGFRRGKVPRYILEKRFADQVTDDVSTALVKETFADAIKESNIVPITEPVLDKESLLKQGEDFKYSVTLEVKPTFDLPEYTGIEIEKEKLVVDDKKVNDRIEKIREARATLSSVEEERPVQKGDFVVLNYEAFDGDVLLEDMTAKGAVLRIGDNRIHADMDEALVGANKGDRKEVSVVFQENDSRPLLAGKKIRFDVEIIDIKSLILPDLNDDFAKQLDPDLNGVEDLKNRVRELVTEEEKQRIDSETKNRLLERIAEKVDFELPQGIVDNELKVVVSNVQRELMEAGTDLERMGISEEKIRKDFRDFAEKRVKNMFILGEIATRENIELSDDDVNMELETVARNTNQTVEIIRKYYEENNMMGKMKEGLMEKKTLSFLLDNAKIIETEKVETEKNEAG